MINLFFILCKDSVIKDRVLFFYLIYRWKGLLALGQRWRVARFINWRNVAKQAKSDVNVNEDFMEVCLMGDFLITDMNFLGRTELNGSH